MIPNTPSPFSPDCLAGRLVVITGGGGALGVEIVRHLAAHGAQVVNADLAPPAHPLPAEFVACDCTKEDEVVAFFDTVEKTFGRAPDAVLAHAGKVHGHPLDELPLDVWKSVVDLNLTGAFLVSREAARRMKKAAPGGPVPKIVFTSSWIQSVPWPGIGAYNASKGGLLMLCRTLARELAPHGVRVNALAPGIVNAGMAKECWDNDPVYRARAGKAVPLGVLQETRSVADAMVFLCSSASDYMTGATLAVDGGCSLYPMI